MVNKELSEILYIYQEKINGKVFDIEKAKEVINLIAKRKGNELDQFKTLIIEKFRSFQEKNEKRVIKKTYTTYLSNNFEQFFAQFIHIFFGLDKESLKVDLKEKISSSLLILEYAYYLSPKEMEKFEEIAQKIPGNLTDSLFLTRYLYVVLKVLGILVKDLTGENLLISLDCANVVDDNEHKKLKFLVLIRESREDIFENYLQMTLYYFLKQIKGIPDQYFKKLLEGREELYEIAYKEYFIIREKLIDLLYYFYKKCKLLGNFCPILDLLNYVCSRVEDSIYSKKDIIQKDFLVNFDYTLEKKNAILEIFDFLDKKSTLYSTFQANNLPSPKAQFNLLLLILKYFFSSGLEALEVGDLLFLPEEFKDQLNEYNLKEKENTIGAHSIKNIGLFINYLAILSNITDADVFAKKIFGKDVNLINYKFFRTFLNSFNIKIALLVEEKNTKLSENPKNKLFTFNIVIDHICRIIYVLIDKIFLRKTPEEASDNFIDPRGRYVGKNIALRVLELLIFQEFNFSDDIWPEYLISLNKEKVIKDLREYTEIPSKYFYKDIELVKFLTMFNLHSFTQERTFEKWLIQEIIAPLNKFINSIRDSIKDPHNNIEVYEVLSNWMTKDITNEKIINDFKFVCQQMAPFWSKIE